MNKVTNNACFQNKYLFPCTLYLKYYLYHEHHKYKKYFLK